MSRSDAERDEGGDLGTCDVCKADACDGDVCLACGAERCPDCGVYGDDLSPNCDECHHAATMDLADAKSERERDARAAADDHALTAWKERRHLD